MSSDYGRGDSPQGPGRQEVYPPKEVMTVEMVAEYLNLTVDEVTKLVKGRRIPCAKIAGKWLFPRKQVLDWIVSEWFKRLT